MPSKSKRQAKAEPLGDLLDRLATSVQLCFAKKPVTSREVAAAEEMLGNHLPRPYVELVTQRGVFWLQGFYGSQPVGNPFDELLSPSRIVRDTRDWKKLLEDMIRDGDPISQKMVDGMVVFFHHGGGNVAVFNTAHRRGRDMATQDFYYDNIPLAWSRAFVGFDEFIRAQLANVFSAARR
jgi:hypothetical protein